MKNLKDVKEAIKKHITLGEYVKSKGLINNIMEEEQFSCHFHGVDHKKSARYYKSTDSAYCWVCKESWDLFSFVAKEEGLTFKETLNALIKRYRVDISKLPDALEVNQKKYGQKVDVKINNREIFVERIKEAIVLIKDEIDFEKYKRIVTAYMLLKFGTPEEKFEAYAQQLRGSLLKIMGHESHE